MTKLSLDEQILADEAELEKLESNDPVKVEEGEPVEGAEPKVEQEPEVKVEVTEPKPEVKLEQKQDITAELAFQLREERRLRKEAEERATKAAPVTDADPMPDATEDPIAYLAWENRQLKKDMEGVKEWKTQREQETQAQQAANQRITAFQSDSAVFAAQAPDFEPVIDHMFNSLKQAARLISPNATPAQIEQFARDRMLTWGEEYRKQGYNSAQALYLLSKQHGYTPPAPPEPEPVKIGKASLATIEKNKSKSASGLGTGSTKSNVLTPEAFAKMSISEMEANAREIEEQFGAV